MEGDFRYWCDLLDVVAERANENTAAMFKEANQPLAPDADSLAVEASIMSGALIAIASQLAYGNAVAAATFYMSNREGGDE